MIVTLIMANSKLNDRFNTESVINIVFLMRDRINGTNKEMSL